MRDRETMWKRLNFIYGSEETAREAMDKICGKLEKYEKCDGAESQGTTETEREKKDAHRTSCGRLTEKDTMLITYGDTIRDGERYGLEVLGEFLEEYVGDAIENVHLLPMYPYTSDDGFSVVDYRKINPALGDWPQVHALAEKYGLMFDAVVNHISKSSEWFQSYLKGEEPYTNYFHTCDPDADYSMVTRPRALPLLTEFKTAEGRKHVWTTFSEDQIDLNFSSPDVLAEIVDLLVFYGRSGAKFIRLDAIGFLWKELGTTCMHHPKTHEVIKLMKDVLREYSPETKIITETNVPHKDNISYFGNGSDEADLVYQFPLPPLTMYTLLTGDATILSRWMETLELPGEKVTFFNFLSSHDGIGVRPTEGILTAEQQQFLVNSTLKNGGRVSYKDNGDGTRSPYELNINYQDALAGPDDSDEVRVGRFLAAETILLSMQGMPAIYIHSLLGSRNDYAGMTASGIPRRINREQICLDYLKEQLEGDTNRSRIFHEMIRRLRIRRGQKAFAPEASQKILHLHPGVLAFRRGDAEPVYVLVNVTGKEVKLELPDIQGRNLLSEDGRQEINGSILLGAYEAAWIRIQ